MNFGTLGFSGKGSGYEIIGADTITRVGNRVLYTFLRTGSLALMKKAGKGGLLRVESKLFCDVLLVGGGGGGMIGGGGGGGVLFYRDYEFQAGEYPIVVGEGGGCGYENGVGSIMWINSSGGLTMIGQNLIAWGGGRGGTAFSGTPTTGSTNVTWSSIYGADGGCGGGAGANGASPYRGLGFPGQGFEGGYSLHSGDPWPGSSGGGAGAPGGNARTSSGTTTIIDPGGAGKVCNITGSNVTYGGGGGGNDWIRSVYGNGGAGGGGRGGGSGNGYNGTHGLGGGGGGSQQGNFSGSGGSGIVIISVPN